MLDKIDVSLLSEYLPGRDAALLLSLFTLITAFSKSRRTFNWHARARAHTHTPKKTRSGKGAQITFKTFDIINIKILLSSLLKLKLIYDYWTRPIIIIIIVIIIY